MAEPVARKYLDPKVINRISRLDLRARLIVEGFLTGLHRSPYHGYSVEFAQHREYVPGDEIKHLDWKVWARNDRYYVKQYEEDTNLRCTLLLDASRSMRYGAPGGGRRRGVSKFDYARTLAASLAYLLNRQQDAVGLVTFDVAVRRHLPARTSAPHLNAIFRALDEAAPDDRTDVAAVFPQLAEEIRRRGMVVLISDLLADPGALETGLKRFRARRHEVVVFQILHHEELTFPFRDNTLFRGLETEAEILTEPPALRKAYLENLQRFLGRIRRLCADNGIDYVLLDTADPLDAGLSGYLAFRRRTAGARAATGL